MNFPKEAPLNPFREREDYEIVVANPYIGHLDWVGGRQVLTLPIAAAKALLENELRVLDFAIKKDGAS